MSYYRIVVEILSNCCPIVHVISNCSRIVLELMSNCVELMSKLSLIVVEFSNCCQCFVGMMSKISRIVVELSICCRCAIELFLSWCRNCIDSLSYRWVFVGYSLNYPNYFIYSLNLTKICFTTNNKVSNINSLKFYTCMTRFIWP